MLCNITQLKKNFTKVNEQTKIEIFKGINFSLDRAETAAIVGRSGSGKSTLLAMIAGIDRDYEGLIEFDGQNIAQLSEEQITKLRAKEMGVVFQQYHLMAHLNALENVMLPLEILNIKNPHQKAMDMLDKVGLADRAKHFPAILSGGEKQRVAIARAIVCEHSLILADEPTGSLDETSGDLIIELFFNLVKQFNSALVIVTHSMEIAAKADKIFQINHGNLELKQP